MALKTNSKKAKQNIINYIFSDIDYLQERAEEDGIVLDVNSPAAVCSYIWKIFQLEKPHNDYYFRRGFSIYDTFKEWASGLALGSMVLYFYNVSAVETLGNILEESETERNKYSENQAEDLLTRLIYRAIQENKQEA